MKKPYLYEGIEAESYDLVDELSEFEDYPFLRLLLEGRPGPVLDLGCGTGRILALLLEDGLDAVGLDYSPQMLEICRRKLSDRGLSAPLVEGDMRTFQLDTRFASIIIPGFSIQMLADDAEMESCLRCCLSHLEPGGQIIIPTYFPWEMIDSGKDEQPLTSRSPANPDGRGAAYRAEQGWRIDRVAQTLQLRNRFEVLNEDGSVARTETGSMAMRWFMPYEMHSILEKAGFGDISLYGDFEFQAPLEDAETIVYVARRLD